MSGRSNGITGILDSRATGLFSSTRRGRTGLQQKSGQISEELAAQTQGTEAQVKFAYFIVGNLLTDFPYRREQWPMFSSYACWQQLVNQTKSLSKDHAALSEVYATHLVARLQTVIEDVQRIYKKCREIGYETHEEILRVLQELHTTMKTYHSYQVNGIRLVFLLSCLLTISNYQSTNLD